MASLFHNHDGPLLPEFLTLLVKGPYPTAAPFNLALSFPKRSVIMLSSRDNLRPLLQGQKLTGRIAAFAEQVQIFYPPTAAHMALILSALQVIQTESMPPDTSSYSPHLLKPPGPALVIIHELSAYFSNTHSSSMPSSSYLSLVMRAISLASRLGARLAIFDTQVNQLRMPVYLDPNSHSERMQEIAPLLVNYIEHIIDFETAQNSTES
ncbi:hypothetical protein GYMLUDRAFT_239998 [Collybiopsis luxurians FD-317 M1]|nr:hypothetical protein GYMLUDRAFT_239998 [Collybiopsis luxurians FD-317 M1]